MNFKKLIFSIFVLFIFLAPIVIVYAEDTFIFNKDLKIGNINNDVKELQKYLNLNGFTVSLDGAGSINKETTIFGTKTKKAVILFQKANIISQDGIVGPITRGIINKKNIKSEVGTEEIKSVIPVGYILTSNGLVKIRGGGSTHRTITYNLSYTAGTGGIITGAISQTVNNSANGTEVIAVPNSGYHFTSWSDSSTQNPRIDTNVSSDLSVTASFAINTYTITFDGNTADGGSTATQTLDYNTPTNLTANGFTRTGYTFAGWNTTADGTGTDYTEGANYTANASVTLYAKWTVALFTCGDNVSFTYNGSLVIYGTVENTSTGKCWLDRNLGASQVATSSTDTLAYGDFFQWGRPADGHQVSTSATQSDQVATITPGTNTFIISSGDWSSVDSDGAMRSAYFAKNDGTGICPTGFRVPTETEFNVERGSWSSNNSAGAFASPLKLPVAGYRSYSNGSLDDVGVSGNYWSSTVGGISSRNLGFVSDDAYMGSADRAFGVAVRCIQEIATAPSSITLAVGSTAPVGGITNVAIPAAGATDTTGAITEWVATSADKIKFTVVNEGSATSSITIGGAAYTSGADYTIPSASPLTIIVTTTEVGKTTATRTFTVSVAAAVVPTIGMDYQGGKVAYIFQAGDPGYVAGETHGIIAATTNQSSGIVWAKLANQSSSVPGGTLATIGSGSSNTDNIIAQNGLDSTYAAGIARSYTGGGYNDWYLPSLDELTKVHANQTIVGNFSADYYWSSTEGAANLAWSKYFFLGSSISSQLKSTPWTYVRAVRSF